MSSSDNCAASSPERGRGNPTLAIKGEAVERFVKRTHRCGNCILWLEPSEHGVGVCDVGAMQPLQGFDGNGVMKDDNRFYTTAETYCDHQVPVPPPGPPCPKCGADLHQGFGLAGGGYGAYEACLADGCDHFEKWECSDD